MEFIVKIQATAAPLVEEMRTKYLLIFRMTSFRLTSFRLTNDYTLKNKI